MVLSSIKEWENRQELRDKIEALVRDNEDLLINIMKHYFINGGRIPVLGLLFHNQLNHADIDAIAKGLKNGAASFEELETWLRQTRNREAPNLASLIVESIWEELECSYNGTYIYLPNRCEREHLPILKFACELVKQPGQKETSENRRKP